MTDINTNTQNTDDDSGNNSQPFKPPPKKGVQVSKQEKFSQDLETGRQSSDIDNKVSGFLQADQEFDFPPKLNRNLSNQMHQNQHSNQYQNDRVQDQQRQFQQFSNRPEPDGEFCQDNSNNVNQRRPNSREEVVDAAKDAYEQKCKIYVSGLNKSTDERELQANFMMFGDIKDMVRKYDWALILYDRPDAAQQAIAEMNDIYIDDCQVQVRMAKKGPNADKPRYKTQFQPIQRRDDSDNEEDKFVPPPMGKRSYADRNDNRDQNYNKSDRHNEFNNYRQGGQRGGGSERWGNVKGSSYGNGKKQQSEEPLWGQEQGGPFDPDDEKDLQENINSYNNQAQNPSMASNGQDKCYRCKQPGHWTRECPIGQYVARSGDDQKRMKASMGGGRNVNQFNNCKGSNFGSNPQTRQKSDFSCYKCSLTGHYARNCPNSGGSGGKSMMA